MSVKLGGGTASLFVLLHVKVLRFIKPVDSYFNVPRSSLSVDKSLFLFSSLFDSKDCCIWIDTQMMSRQWTGGKAQSKADSAFPASPFLHFLIASVSDCATIMEMWSHKPIRLDRTSSRMMRCANLQFT